MRCECGARLNCKDTRETKAGMSRKYVCPACGAKVSTVEMVRGEATPNSKPGLASLVTKIEAEMRAQMKRRIIEDIERLL